MFKNLIFFRIAGPLDAYKITECMNADGFTPCAPSQSQSTGWMPPREAEGALLETVAGAWIAKFVVEKKSVPATALRERVEEMARDIEEQTGRVPGKREKKDLREDALQELLPRAFPRYASHLVWIDPETGLLAIDATSLARCDDVVTALMRCLPAGVRITMVQTKSAPESVMTAWLLDPEIVPDAFTVGTSCTLQGGGEMPAKVRFDNHTMDSEAVAHIRKGHTPIALAMDWQGAVSFTLTDALAMRKIAVDSGDAPAGDADAFDADVAIWTCEISQAFDDLLQAMGGEKAAA